LSVHKFGSNTLLVVQTGHPLSGSTRCVITLFVDFCRKHMIFTTCFCNYMYTCAWNLWNCFIVQYYYMYCLFTLKHGGSLYFDNYVHCMLVTTTNSEDCPLKQLHNYTHTHTYIYTLLNVVENHVPRKVVGRQPTNCTCYQISVQL